jgi:hypothetical protein
MYDDLLIQIDYWNHDEWEKILTHVNYYCADYEEDEDGNILVHCDSETEYWELYDFLHKLGQ